MEVRLLGRAVGHATGWDDVGDDTVVFYEFEPNWDLLEEFRGLDMSVDFTNGIITGWSEHRIVERHIVWELR